MRKLLCGLKGHDTNEFDAYTCQRCGRFHDGSPAWSGSLWWRLMLWPRWLFGWHPWDCSRPSRLQRWRAWWRCRYCGCRFGRHTGECNDIPF